MADGTDRVSATHRKVFVAVQGTWGNDLSMVAICECGEVLAGHVCSSLGFAMRDMGVNEDGWKRDIYNAHCEPGYTVELVHPDSWKEHTEFLAACEANKRLAATVENSK